MNIINMFKGGGDLMQSSILQSTLKKYMREKGINAICVKLNEAGEIDFLFSSQPDAELFSSKEVKELKQFKLKTELGI